MKAIIKGRGYVTDNAELLGEVTLNGARTGLKWWSAGLYRIQRAGCYFLAGVGNSMTGWRRRVDSGGWAEGQGTGGRHRGDRQRSVGARALPRDKEAGGYRVVQERQACEMSS